MKISTMQAIAVIIFLDYSSYFCAGFAAASVQRPWSGVKHKAVSKSRNDERKPSEIILIHSKIALGLFLWCLQGDYVFNTFFIASQGNSNTSSQLLKIRKMFTAAL